MRFPGGAVLNCWGGGAAQTASLEKADDRFVTKVNLFCNGPELNDIFMYKQSGIGRTFILNSDSH